MSISLVLGSVINSISYELQSCLKLRHIFLSWIMWRSQWWKVGANIFLKVRRRLHVAQRTGDGCNWLVVENGNSQNGS